MLQILDGGQMGKGERDAEGTKDRRGRERGMQEGRGTDGVCTNMEAACSEAPY